jgi:hypothetical protein
VTLIHKFEIFVLTVILGLIAPLVGLLAFWFGSVPLLPESQVIFAALGGLLLGLLADAIFLRRVVRKAYQLDLRIWMAIHLFYSVCIFGFFMGVPVFNALLALPAGFVMGGRLLQENADPARVRKAARSTALFTAAVLALICIASAAMALVSPSTPSDLQGMLGLGFPVTQGMVIVLIIIGGLGLLAFGWGLALISVRFCFTFLQWKDASDRKL